MDSSNLFLLFAKKIPTLFTKQSINELVTQNRISFEHAKESLAAVDLTNNSRENPTNSKTTVEKMQKLGFYGQVKFEAMLESAKEDERILYEEFASIDDERNKLIAEIASKKENDVNALLKSLKTLPEVDEKEIDDLISLSVKVEDIR